MEHILNEGPILETYGSAVGRENFVEKSDIKGRTVLDIGCGYGWFENYSIKKGVKSIVGIDSSEHALNVARKYIKDKRARFLKGSATKLNFEENSFDSTFCWEVVEHLPKSSEHLMFSEVKRVLKPGGKFYLSTPYDSFFSKVTDPAWWLVGHRHYSLDKLRELGEKQSFRVTRYWVRGGWYWIFFTLNMYISKWIFRREPFFKDKLSKLATKEYKGQRGFVTVFVKYEK